MHVTCFEQPGVVSDERRSGPGGGARARSLRKCRCKGLARGRRWRWRCRWRWRWMRRGSCCSELEVFIIEINSSYHPTQVNMDQPGCAKLVLQLILLSHGCRTFRLFSAGRQMQIASLRHGGRMVTRYLGYAFFLSYTMYCRPYSSQPSALPPYRLASGLG